MTLLLLARISAGRFI